MPHVGFNNIPKGIIIELLSVVNKPLCLGDKLNLTLGHLIFLPRLTTVIFFAYIDRTFLSGLILGRYIIIILVCLLITTGGTLIINYLRSSKFNILG